MKNKNIEFIRTYSDEADDEKKLLEVYEYIFNQLKLEDKIK